MTDLIWSQRNLSWWCRMCLSNAHTDKNLSFKIQDGLRDQFCIIFDFKNGVCPPAWIFEIKNFNSCALYRRVLHHRAKFYGDRSYRCSDIEKFREFFTVAEWNVNILYTGWARKRGHRLMSIFCQILTDLQFFLLEDSLVNLQLNAY